MLSFLARCRGLVMFCRASLRAAASVWCIFNLFLFKKTMKELNSFYRNSITSLTSKERSIFDFSWNVVNCIFAAWRRIWQPELLSHSCCSFFWISLLQCDVSFSPKRGNECRRSTLSIFFFVNAQQLLRSMTESLIYLLRIWHEAQSCSYLYIETVKKKKLQLFYFHVNNLSSLPRPCKSHDPTRTH